MYWKVTTSVLEVPPPPKPPKVRQFGRRIRTVKIGSNADHPNIVFIDEDSQGGGDPMHAKCDFQDDTMHNAAAITES
jgi:hypothetical protein